MNSWKEKNKDTTLETPTFKEIKERRETSKGERKTTEMLKGGMRSQNRSTSRTKKLLKNKRSLRTEEVSLDLC